MRPNDYVPEYAQNAVIRLSKDSDNYPPSIPNKEAIFNDGASAVRRVLRCANKYHVCRSRLPTDKQQIT